MLLGKAPIQKSQDTKPRVPVSSSTLHTPNPLTMFNIPEISLPDVPKCHPLHSNFFTQGCLRELSEIFALLGA